MPCKNFAEAVQYLAARLMGLGLGDSSRVMDLSKLLRREELLIQIRIEFDFVYHQHGLGSS